jgi:phosphatidylserine/phosphatidylglycerophosphate/cardiolipin synthase-like enzyme
VPNSGCRLLLGCDILAGMKKLIFALLLLFPGIHEPAAPAPAVEIVESIPVGTTLDNPEIRNAQPVWIEMIARARRTLDIEQFYISNEPGKLLESVLTAIASAADRGVRVRIIVDAGMYKTYPHSADILGRHKNIEVRRIDFPAIAGGPQHAKYFIVDGREIFVGSQNFDWRALEHIHELGLRIENEALAAAYGDIFNLDWQLSTLSAVAAKNFAIVHKKYPFPIRIEGTGGDTVTLFPTFSPLNYFPDPALWDERAMVDLIDGAEHTLTLQFLSFSTVDRRGGAYTAIDGAIRKAAQRGVKVRMIVSDWQKGTPAVTALKSLAAVPNVEVAFTSIPEWSGGYIPFARVEHCKFIVADAVKFWLGTSNCEKSYYYSSRNLGIVCASPRLAGTFARIFQKSWESPYRESITQAGEYAPREHGEKK